MDMVNTLLKTLQGYLAVVGLDSLSSEGLLFAGGFGGGFGLAATILLLIAGIQTRKAMRSKSWPTTEGVVLASDVVSTHSSEGGTSYRADVAYRYNVGERTYTNDLVAFGAKNSFGGYGGAVKTADKYVPGSPVRVHYDPNKPQTAVLETRSAAGCMMGIMGAVFLCVAVFGVAMGLAAWS